MSYIACSPFELRAEHLVFEQQQGQQQGQGQGQGHPCESWHPRDAHRLYADETNHYYIYKIPNGYSGELQVVSWSGSNPDEEIPTYEGSPYNTTSTFKYVEYLRYQSKLASPNGVDSGCVAQMQTSYSNPGFVVLFPTPPNTDLWGSQTDWVDDTNTTKWEKVWKAAKETHEQSLIGCTDSKAYNYDESAIKDDDSCLYCEDKEEYDDVKNQCVCKDGYEKNTSGNCIQTPSAEGINIQEHLKKYWWVYGLGTVALIGGNMALNMPPPAA